MKSENGFTLLIAVITTSILLMVSFAVTSVAFRQLTLSQSMKQSQYAFYAADSGLECAQYWDLNNSALSSFSTATPGIITCNNQTIKTKSQTVPTSPAQDSFIGGGYKTEATSTFYITYPKGCAIVTVFKSVDGETTIDSRGYNTCDTSASKRFERGVSITYENRPDNDAVRKATLLKLKAAVELYKTANGSYPNPGPARSSEQGDPWYFGDWIPGLVPTYIPVLPHDPRGEEVSNVTAACTSGGWHRAYIYISDGNNYKIISHCSSESGYSPTDQFYDPQRPTWAWQVSSPGGINL